MEQEGGDPSEKGVEVFRSSHEHSMSISIWIDWFNETFWVQTLQITTFFLLTCLIQGHLASQYEALNIDDTICNDDSLTFEALKKKLTKQQGSLEMYLSVVIEDFQIPRNHAYDIQPNVPSNPEPCPTSGTTKFVGLPSNQRMDDRQLRQFQREINTMKKWRDIGIAYINNPVAKNVRLMKE
jgi:hypothetical protein